jgi:hypothetical protein
MLPCDFQPGRCALLFLLLCGLGWGHPALEATSVKSGGNTAGTVLLDPSPDAKAWRQWALNLSAIVIEQNKGKHQLLGAAVATLDSVAEEKRLLERDWGITSRADLLETIGELRAGMHAPVFHQLAQAWQSHLESGAGDKDFWTAITPNLDDKELAYLRYISINFERFDGRDLSLWDKGRAISLARWGFLVDFLKETEAWEIIIDVAEELRPHYRSWQDYGDMYSLARSAWAAGFGQELKYWTRSQEIVRALMTPGGAWQSTPWPSGPYRSKGGVKP